jgi:hypothetical protein
MDELKTKTITWDIPADLLKIKYAYAVTTPLLPEFIIITSLVILKYTNWMALPKEEGFDYPSNIDVIELNQGGHLGFISSKKTEFNDYFWMDWVAYKLVKQLEGK